MSEKNEGRVLLITGCRAGHGDRHREGGFGGGTAGESCDFAKASYLTWLPSNSDRLESKITSQLYLETIRRPFQTCSRALIVDDEEITIGPIDVTKPHVND